MTNKQTDRESDRNKELRNKQTTQMTEKHESMKERGQCRKAPYIYTHIDMYWLHMATD